MKKMDNQIHIVFICDENYVMPTVVAITSLSMNKDKDTYYSIHVLTNNISYNSQLMFRNLEKETIQIEILDQTQSSLFTKCKIENLHVSTAALYKFTIATLFPQYEKILYLDSDILVQKDLSKLYNTDISSVYAAVVKDYKPMTYNPPQVEKLGVNHTSYFNSGVMLLNLNKLREDDLFHKLLDYRLHGINFFMDQDALNVVFQKKVIYLPFLYNVMSSVMGFFKTESIIKYYGLPESISKEDIYNYAVVVHLCTKYKPWSYLNVPFADEWMFYYNHSVLQKTLKRKKLDISIQNKIFAEIGYKMTARTLNISNDIIVSLTSYPARIQFVSKVISSIFDQTVKADKILLWLAEEQFPNREEDLSEELLEQTKKGLEIRWCDDLKPHKKYYYTMQEFPDSIVITVDDDVIYNSKLIETLLISYIHYPFAVSAMRAHLIKFDENGKISPYCKWKREYKYFGIPSMALCATGVGGILYPPRVMHEELFNKNQIYKLCIYADDLWLKVMQILTNTPVVIAGESAKLLYIENSQSEALWKTNDAEGANDIQFSKILENYDTYLSENDTVIQRIRLSELYLESLFEIKSGNSNLKAQLKKAKQEIIAIHTSWSYRIGRFITFIPRKVRGVIRCYKEHGILFTLKRIETKIERFFYRR